MNKIALICLAAGLLCLAGCQTKETNEKSLDTFLLYAGAYQIGSITGLSSQPVDLNHDHITGSLMDEFVVLTRQESVIDGQSAIQDIRTEGPYEITGQQKSLSVEFDCELSIPFVRENLDGLPQINLDNYIYHSHFEIDKEGNIVLLENEYDNARIDSMTPAAITVTLPGYSLFDFASEQQINGDLTIRFVHR